MWACSVQSLPVDHEPTLTNHPDATCISTTLFVALP